MLQLSGFYYSFGDSGLSKIQGRHAHVRDHKDNPSQRCLQCQRCDHALSLSLSAFGSGPFFSGPEIRKSWILNLHDSMTKPTTSERKSAEHSRCGPIVSMAIVQALAFDPHCNETAEAYSCIFWCRMRAVIQQM